MLNNAQIDHAILSALGRGGAPEPRAIMEPPPHAAYAWRPGSDDVKLIFAISDESAARIAVQARMRAGMSAEEAVDHVLNRDDLRAVDPEVLVMGTPEAPLFVSRTQDGLDEAVITP